MISCLGTNCVLDISHIPPISSDGSTCSCSHHSTRYRGQNTILIILCLEKSVAQRDGVDFLHSWIIRELWVDEEEHWHVDRLALVELLFLEAEALDLAEVWCHLRRRYAVRGHTDNIRFTPVRSSIESQSCLPR